MTVSNIACPCGGTMKAHERGDDLMRKAFGIEDTDLRKAF